MNRRRFWLIVAGATMTVAILGAVARNQVKVYRGRQARAAVALQRNAFFAMLQPVALTNCQLQRFGERHDGGYLMCGNLLSGAQTGYSYGISGYDKWGCDISTALQFPVHQYDCFNTTEPVCSSGATVFHAECVGDKTETLEGRIFDTLANQIAKNSDGSKRVVLKIDVEGAEWDSLLSVPDEILRQIDQMAVEFHWMQDEQFNWVQDSKYPRVVGRLRQFFEVAHVHFNNASCVDGLEPFPTWAFEVTFVSKRLAVVDPSGKAGGLDPQDAPNDPSFADCQPKVR